MSQKSSELISKALDREIDPAFAARAEIIFDTVIKHKPSRVLDCGCGRGFYLKLLSKLEFVEQAVGIDIREENLHRCGTKHLEEARSLKLQLSQASILALPFPDNCFDAIICSEVLEHVCNDRQAVSEIARVLKPGGIAIFTVPHSNFPFMWDPINWFLMRIAGTHIPSDIHWLAGIWADHVRLYGRENLQAVLEANFSVESIQGVISWCWPFSHLLLYGIGKNLVERCNLKSFDRFSEVPHSGFRQRCARALAYTMRFPNLLGQKMGFAEDSTIARGANLVAVVVKPE